MAALVCAGGGTAEEGREEGTWLPWQGGGRVGRGADGQNTSSTSSPTSTQTSPAHDPSSPPPLPHPLHPMPPPLPTSCPTRPPHLSILCTYYFNAPTPTHTYTHAP